MSAEAQLKSVIDAAFERRAKLTPGNTSDELDERPSPALLVPGRRDGEPSRRGRLGGERVAEGGAALVGTRDNELIRGGFTNFYDRVPLKYAHTSEAPARAGARIVPHAIVRHGAYVVPNVVLMPSYVNIGAYIGAGTMVDTWATVGSCAQIGSNVHLSGGVGIGGVLEPLQAAPTIIEDDCFIGARSEIVEGVIVEAGSVISMGVFIGQSTRIYERSTGQILRGRVPAGSVVVSGTLPAADGSHSLYCAVIVKRVDAQTRAKTSINELLRSLDS
jgi:2,3,4,5-tetrahydropyridine-2-carboxylate N-succinyltransferase